MAVMKFLASDFSRHGSRDHRYSVRQIAEGAGIGRPSACNCVSLVIKVGMIRAVAPSMGPRSRTYELCGLPPRQNDAAHDSVCSSLFSSTVMGSAWGSYASSDVFRNSKGGLYHGRDAAYAMVLNGAVRLADLPPDLRRVTKHRFSKLAEKGLIAQRGDEWVQTDLRPHDVASSLPTFGAGEKTRMRHAKERKRYADKLKERGIPMVVMDDSSVANPETGEEIAPPVRYAARRRLSLGKRPT